MPILLIERSLKVATPATALVESVPLSVPAPGFVPIAIVTVALLEVTTLLPASCSVATTAGLIVVAEVVVVGACV